MACSLGGCMWLRAFWPVQSVFILLILLACSGPKSKSGAQAEVMPSGEQAGAIDATAIATEAPEWSGWMLREPEAVRSQFQTERAGAMARQYQWPDSQPLSVSLLFWFGVIATLAYVLSRLQQHFHHKPTS